MKKRTQKEIIADKLKTDGEVSNVWAFHNYILRLGAIIHSLRQDGWKIDGDYIESTKNWNYKLIDSPKRRVSEYVPIIVDGRQVGVKEVVKLV